MTITRFAPFRGPVSDAALLQNRLNSIFEAVAWPTSQNGLNGSGSTESVATGSFVPAVDIYEDGQKVVVKLDVPGIAQKDLDVRVENQTLTVKGSRKFEAEEKKENFRRIGRRYGSFVRSFTVPQTVDTESVTANYDAGVLTVSLAKKAEAKPKQVKIGVGTATTASPAEQPKVETPAA